MHCLFQAQRGSTEALTDIAPHVWTQTHHKVSYGVYDPLNRFPLTVRLKRVALLCPLCAIQEHSALLRCIFASNTKEQSRKRRRNFVHIHQKGHGTRATPQAQHELQMSTDGLAFILSGELDCREAKHVRRTCSKHVGSNHQAGPAVAFGCGG